MVISVEVNGIWQVGLYIQPKVPEASDPGQPLLLPALCAREAIIAVMRR